MALKIVTLFVIFFWLRFLLLAASDEDVDDVCKGFKKTIKIANNITQCFQEKSTQRDGIIRWQCPSLETALNLNSSVFTDTCIELDHRIEEKLTTVHVLRDSRNFKISSRESVTIGCQSKNCGISFVQGEEIEVSNLKFKYCGGTLESYYRHSRYVGKNQRLYKMNLTAVLNFEDVKSITMTSIDMTNFRGYGIVMTDCVGVINLQKFSLDSNTPAPCIFEELKETSFSYGGGLMFRHISEKVLDGTVLKISEMPTELLNIRAVNFTTASLNLSNFTDLKPFGYGGGISLFFYRSTRNSVYLNYPVIRGNLAIFGGGFYLYHGEDSKNNIIQLQHLMCYSNTAIYSGGCIDYENEKYPYENNNTFIFEDFYSMSRNTASYGFGGAFCNHKRADAGEKHGLIDKSFVKTFFKGTNENKRFDNNNAKLGSAMFFQRAYIGFDGTIMINSNNNDILPDHSSGFGAVYFFESHLFLDGATIFMDNQMTGLVLEFSYVHLIGTLQLRDNIGIRGGGMVLFGQSQIILKHEDATLKVTNNKANQGAGIYVHLQGPFNDILESYNVPVYDCFFRFAVVSNRKRIFFKGNNHSDIFASSLRPCADSDNPLSFFLNSTEFDFNNKENPISTDPIRIHFPDSDIWGNMYPGTKVIVPVELIDETDNTVSSSVKLSIIGVNVLLENGQTDIDLIVVDNKIEFRLLISQKPNVSFELELSVNDNVVANPQNRKATFAFCPFGYIFEKNLCYCDPTKNNEKGIVECDKENGDVHVFSNTWFNPTIEHLRDDSEMGLPCPNNYCRKCNLADEDSVTCIFNKSNQCNIGRDQTSFLCSKCEERKFLTWGSEECVEQCSKWYIILVVIIFALFLFAAIFFVIVFFNIDVYESYLSPVIFFYQVARLFLTTTQDYDSVLKFIFALCNFEGTGSNFPWKICFGLSFTEHWKPVPSLILIFLAVIFLILAIFFRSHIHSKYKDSHSMFVGYLLSETSYKAVVFLIIYLYGALVQICMNAISLIYAENEIRLYSDADVVFGDKTDIMVIFSVCVLILIFALVFPLLVRFQSKLVDNDFIRHVCYLFKAPFCNEKSLFPYYYMIIGNAIKIIQAIMILDTAKKQTILTVSAICSVLFLIVFTLTKPYKNQSGAILSLNNFDALILFVLCLVGVISNAKQKIPSFDELEPKLNIAIRVLLWFPIGFCVIMNFARLGLLAISLRDKMKSSGNSLRETLEKHFGGGHPFLMKYDILD